MAKQNEPKTQKEIFGAAIGAEPDLVDRIFDYLASEIPGIDALALKLKEKTRAEFAGQECYISRRPLTDRQKEVQQVLALFNGRNASEVGRRLGISRATVYRLLKQAGGR